MITYLVSSGTYASIRFTRTRWQPWLLPLAAYSSEPHPSPAFDDMPTRPTYLYPLSTTDILPRLPQGRVHGEQASYSAEFRVGKSGRVVNLSSCAFIIHMSVLISGVLSRPISSGHAVGTTRDSRSQR